MEETIKGWVIRQKDGQGKHIGWYRATYTRRRWTKDINDALIFFDEPVEDYRYENIYVKRIITRTTTTEKEKP